MKTKVVRWVIDYDPDSTRASYERIVPDPDNESCIECRNFWAALDDAFPTAATTLFHQLCIDRRKPAEVYTTGRTDSGLIQYGGWFHFVGYIESGADAWQPRDKDPDTLIGHFEKFTNQFEIGFTSELRIVPEAFHGRPVVQLEFQTYVPWVLAEPQPA